MEQQFINDFTMTKYELDLHQGRIKLVNGELIAEVRVYGYNNVNRLASRYLRLSLTPTEEAAIRTNFQPALQRLKDSLEAKGLVEYEEVEL